MKSFSKTTLGVTLLEIMLVLAIAAMIIVMSVRYYQSASSSQQANMVLSQVQSIAAAADSLSQATGSYQGNVSNSALLPLLPKNGLTTPWGDTIQVQGTGATTYTVSIPNAPPGTCGIILSQLKSNTHFTSLSTTCPGTISYTYKSNI